MSVKTRWYCEEPGWWCLYEDEYPGRWLASIVKEEDGRWHTHLHNTNGPPGETRHRTAKAARRSAERLAQAESADE